MHFILITVSSILFLNKTAKMCFLQSQQIWIGCGPTDCAYFVLHEGILTVCSGGRYLNLGDIHMGGKRRKWKWYPYSLFCMLKGKQTGLHVNAKKIFLPSIWQRYFLVYNFYFCHSSNVQTFSFLSTQYSTLLAHDCLQLLTMQLYINRGLDICLHMEAQ